MFKHHAVLGIILLMTQISFNQDIKHDECHAEPEDLLPVEEESISVLKLLKEENHSEDPEHLSVPLTSLQNLKDGNNADSKSVGKGVVKNSDLNGNGKGIGSKPIVDSEKLGTVVDIKVIHVDSQTVSSKIKEKPSSEVKEEEYSGIKGGEETRRENKGNVQKTVLDSSIKKIKQNDRVGGHETSDNNNKAEKKGVQKEVSAPIKQIGEHRPDTAHKYVTDESQSQSVKESGSVSQVTPGAKIIPILSKSNTRDVIKPSEIPNPTITKRSEIRVTPSPKKDVNIISVTEQPIVSNTVSKSSPNREIIRERRDVSTENTETKKPETNPLALKPESNVKKLDVSNTKLTEKKATIPNQSGSGISVTSHENVLNTSKKVTTQQSDIKRNNPPVTDKSEISDRIQNKQLKEDDVTSSNVTNVVAKVTTDNTAGHPKNPVVLKSNHSQNSGNILKLDDNVSEENEILNGDLKPSNVKNIKVATPERISANNRNVESNPSVPTPKISSPSRNTDTVAKKEIKSINNEPSSITSKTSTNGVFSSPKTDQTVPQRSQSTNSTPEKNSTIIKTNEKQNTKTVLEIPPQSTVSKTNPSSESSQRQKRSISNSNSESLSVKNWSLVPEHEIKATEVSSPKPSLTNQNATLSSPKADSDNTTILPYSSTIHAPTFATSTKKPETAQRIEDKNLKATITNVSVNKVNTQSTTQTFMQKSTSTTGDVNHSTNNLEEEVCTGVKSKNVQPSTSNNSMRDEKQHSPLIHELKNKGGENTEEIIVSCEFTESSTSKSHLNLDNLKNENTNIEIPLLNGNENIMPQKYSATQIEVPSKAILDEDHEEITKSLNVNISAQALQLELPMETNTQSSKTLEKINADKQGNKNEESDSSRSRGYSDHSQSVISINVINSSNNPSILPQPARENEDVTGDGNKKEEIVKGESTSKHLDAMVTNEPYSSTLDGGNYSVTTPSWAEVSPSSHPESQSQSNVDIKEESQRSSSQDAEQPIAEALEQDFADMDSSSFVPAWKLKRGRINQAEDNTIKSPTLEFPPVPEGESFRIHELGLSEGMFVFSYLGSFLSWMQPYDFPVELLRDALWNRLSIVSLITQSLQVEMGFIACLCIGVLLALAAPLFLMIHACCSIVRRSPSSNNWEDESASSSDNQGNCRRRTLVFLLQTILLLLVAGIVAMFVTNEQLSTAVHQTPNVLHTALSDVTTFLRNSNLQLHFVVTKSLDQAVEAASNDLDNIETLLGRPIQRELEEETGVDVALDSLVDATAAAQALSDKVDALHEYCGETRGLALVAQERLADLRHQVDMLRRQCPAKDRALCETVEGSGLDVIIHLDSLLTDQRLAGLRRLSQSNLSQVTQQAKGEFQFIPMHVEKETREARGGVRRQLMRQRSLLDDAVWSIEAVTRDLGVRVDSARDKALQIVRGTSDMEQWRYLTGIGAAVAVLLIWILLVAAVSCGCCGAEDKAGPTLLATVGVLCPLYLALWALAMVALLVGGHGEVFVCRPLYDEPGYGALTKLVDKPGVLFQRGGGFFSSLLYGNDSLNVPLKDVLMACQNNEPSYPSFRLHQVFDVDSASNHHNWEILHKQLSKLEVNLTDLQLLTPDLQAQLQELLNAATVNLTTHRIQLSGPVTGKDLLSFSDQLESVANQITDLATASRMETLATRTRRLLASHIAPLAQRKEDMVYQLTALEVQLLPLQRQVNQSLSHLKTIQFFINNQGANISHSKSQEYINRIVGYLQQYRDHVLHATANSVAPCRPIWDLFHAMRVLFCRHVMDPLNGFWFATVWCLLLLLAAIPVCIKLAACYRQSRPGTLLPRSQSEDGANIWK